MSPTCMTSRTSGSSLIDLMKAGVALNSAVSVGVVPYGSSPNTAIVNGFDELLSGEPLPPASATAAGTASAATTAMLSAIFFITFLQVRSRKMGSNPSPRPPARCYPAVTAGPGEGPLANVARRGRGTGRADKRRGEGRGPRPGQAGGATHPGGRRRP